MLHLWWCLLRVFCKASYTRWAWRCCCGLEKPARRNIFQRRYWRGRCCWSNAKLSQLLLQLWGGLCSICCQPCNPRRSSGEQLPCTKVLKAELRGWGYRGFDTKQFKLLLHRC